MKITALKDKLVACPVYRPWDDKDGDGHSVSELGYARAAHDKYRWWNTWWSVNDGLRTDDLVAEVNAVYDAFKRSFKDRMAMGSWCRANLSSSGDDEYSAYYLGKHGFYWLRMIDRRGDYNLYLHCYSRKAMEKEVA